MSQAERRAACSDARAIEYLNSLAEEARWTRRLQSLPVSVATCEDEEEAHAETQRREEVGTNGERDAH